MIKMEERNSTPHKLHIDNRSNVMVTGVLDVVSFDDKLVVLETVQGILTIKGEELKAHRLTIESGEAVIEGKVCSMEYTDSGRDKAGSFISRLLK